MYLIKPTSFDREILNPALARASTLSDASTVLKDLVLKNTRMTFKSLPIPEWRSVQEARENKLPM